MESKPYLDSLKKHVRRQVLCDPYDLYRDQALVSNTGSIGQQSYGQIESLYKYYGKLAASFSGVFHSYVLYFLFALNAVSAGEKPYVIPEASEYGKGPGASATTLNSFGRSTDQILTESEDRDTWGHKAEFLLASIGLAVGLGNVWRFPYLCQKNGGGAFLIPYVIFMIIEGIPLFFIEYGIGQRLRMSAIGCWGKVHPALKGVGVGAMMVSFMLCIYYVVVITWCLYYMFISFTSHLPWTKDKCPNYAGYIRARDNYTALKRMLDNGTTSPYYNVTNMTAIAKQRYENYPDCCVRDTPMWYFYTKALKVSTDIEDQGSGMNGPLVGCLVLAWVITYACIVKGVKSSGKVSTDIEDQGSGMNGPLVGCLVLAWVITYACIVKGVKSSGKVVYFTATFPYVVLIILFFRGVTLEGAGRGVKAFFYPRFELLKDARIWMDAATQMFFTLSLGFGALIAFASYMPRKNNCIRDAYTVVFINCGTSVFAGIVVYSILGHRELKTGIPANQVGSGPGLAFMTFCDAFLLMDVSPLWAILFFFMLILLGIDSEFGTLEAAIAPLYDLKVIPMKKAYFTAIVAVVFFLIGLSMVSSTGFYVFQIFDDYCATLPLLLIALFQCVGISWIYGNDKFANDIEYMTGSRPNIFWMICWKYISPLALLIVFIAAVYQTAADKPKYQAYVGCEQAPFSSKYSGTKTWTAKLVYPGWAQFIIVCVVLVSTLPILIWMVIGWPTDFVEGFKKRFCSGLVEYHPDPAMMDPSRKKSDYQMEAEIQKEEMEKNKV